MFCYTHKDGFKMYFKTHEAVSNGMLEFNIKSARVSMTETFYKDLLNICAKRWSWKRSVVLPAGKYVTTYDGRSYTLRHDMKVYELSFENMEDHLMFMVRYL